MQSHPVTRLLLGMAVLGTAVSTLAAKPVFAAPLSTFPCYTASSGSPECGGFETYAPVGDKQIIINYSPGDPAKIDFVRSGKSYTLSAVFNPILGSDPTFDANQTFT